MSIGGRRGGGVSEQEGRSDQAYKDVAADARGAARMACVNLPDRMAERTHRTGGSVDTAAVAAIGSYRKSRWRCVLSALGALNFVLIAVSLGLLVQRRRDLGRLRAFVHDVYPWPATQKEVVLNLTRRCYLLRDTRTDASFCPRLFGPLGATPSAVLRLGDCCSGRSRLLILALHEVGVRAYQITLYHRAGQAQHCLVEACLDGQRLIVDPGYGVYYEGPSGEPISLRHLQMGTPPKCVPLLDDPKCGYPSNQYYDFDFRASKTANWTKSRLRRVTYWVLRNITDGAVDRLQVPAFLEWPQHLFIVIAALCAIAVNGAAILLTRL